MCSFDGSKSKKVIETEQHLSNEIDNNQSMQANILFGVSEFVSNFKKILMCLIVFRRKEK